MSAKEQSRPPAVHGLERYERTANDSACLYFARLFAVCDSALNKKFDENVAITKMKGIYLRDGKERARAFLAEQVKAHPKNTQLRSMLDDWADIANGFDQERTMHSERLSTSP